MAGFPDIPAQVGSRPKYKPRTRKSQFGDGYSQRSGDGINTLAEKWQLAWPRLDSVRFETIISFLESQAGIEAFDWTPPLPNATAAKYICEEWNADARRGDRYGITATFERVYDL